jgi:hypothetical protein
MEGRAVPTAIAGGMEEATNMGRKAATTSMVTKTSTGPPGGAVPKAKPLAWYEEIA